jgi:hypothetical protein
MVEKRRISTLSLDNAVADNDLLLFTKDLTGSYSTNNILLSDFKSSVSGDQPNDLIRLDINGDLPELNGSNLLVYQKFKTNQTLSFNLELTDINLWIPCTNTNDITVGLPDSFPDGFQAIIDRQGAGNVTISATTLIGKNVVSDQVPIANQYGVVHVVHTGSNVWRVTGDLG